MGSLRNKMVYLKDNNEYLYHLWHMARNTKLILLDSKLSREAKKRENGYEDQRYIELRKYRDLYRGERCFIVATGPSLTLNDLNLIKDEYSFSMNSICKLYRQTEWRPTFYGIQDDRVYAKMETDIFNCYKDRDNIFVSSSIAKRFEIPSNYKVFPYNTAYHARHAGIGGYEYSAEFSDDPYVVTYDGYSITYSLLEIAVYMGFKEIYLLGVDCSYKRGAKNHVVDSGNDDKNEERNHDMMIVGYQCAKEYADAHDIRIINCTRGGMLEIYPRKDLEDVLKI